MNKEELEQKLLGQQDGLRLKLDYARIDHQKSRDMMNCLIAIAGVN
jgi:hypothetical protein